MPGVYSRRLPVFTFLKAASLHVGATAVALALRRDLVEQGYLSEAEFEESYASARLTPGTTLLALYASLGFRLGGWKGSVIALVTGSVLPGAMVTAVTALYVLNADNPVALLALQGATAAALGVVFASALRLMYPVVRRNGIPAVGIASATVLFILLGTPPLWILLLAAASSMVMLRS